MTSFDAKTDFKQPITVIIIVTVLSSSLQFITINYLDSLVTRINFWGCQTFVNALMSHETLTHADDTLTHTDVA